MHKLLLLSFLMALSIGIQAQVSFTNQTSLLSPALHYSGVAIAVLDMNGDGRDDIVRMEQGHNLSIAYQGAPNQNFVSLPVQDIATASQWGMCAADVDNNGFPDVLAGGRYDNVKIAMANADGSAYSVVQLTTPSTFVQGVNFADINNDGWLDAFVCHDDGPSRIYGNDGTGNFVYQPTWMDLTTLPASDNSGNYGTVWSDVDNDGDLDLYIAKCRQGVNSATDGRRINQLFLNNGDGTYTQDTANVTGLRIGAQSWTADFGDIDNDGDFDCFITNHDVKSMLLENDGSGNFTDISVASGIQAIGGLPIQGVFRDFDNDGYLDVIVAGSEQYLLHNNTDNTFTVVSGVFDNNTMESFAIGDLNHDGFQDVYAGYGEIYTTPSNTPDKLWLNTGNDNHFYGLTLRGVQSNYNAVGAKVILYSALGTQVREVRSGESYGIMNSMQIHFGLGQLTQIDSVVVHWPAGTVDKLFPTSVDQYITLQEGGCLVPEVGIAAAGSTTFCSGDTLDISGPAAFSYLWNTGDTTQTIHATTSGTYQLVITTPEGCTASSNAIVLTVDPVEIPTIVVSGDTIFCAGGSVELTASPATGYTWSDGQNTQSITVSAAGTYYVTTQGLCELFNSAAVGVHVITAGDPVTTTDTVLVGNTATLIATGDSIVWYDAPGGSVLATGDTLLTAPLQVSSTFWVQNLVSSDVPNVFTGQTDHQGSAFAGSQFNGGLVFDCFSPVKLARTKVYTSTAGERKIDLKDNTGQVLQSKTVDLPIGTTIIDLNFDLPIGTDLLLTTDQVVNNTNFGTNSPQLRRSDQGIAFPYVVPGVLSIKTSNIASDRYYYFYNWEIDFYGTTCESELVPVTVQVDTISSGTSGAWGAVDLKLFPNPTSGVVNADFSNLENGEIQFRLLDMQGSVLRQQNLSVGQSSFRHAIDLSMLPKGVYQLEWRQAKGVVQRKVMVF
ncbi:MAG: VCBS repeat-containing protein [Lewinellaceae bacterium]|nr:VCBS repeat-containing protein [Lewinellaceae bacterium]